MTALAPIGAKRAELRDLTRKRNQLRREIREIEQAHARSKLKRLGPQQRQVLATLVHGFVSDNEWEAYSLGNLRAYTDLPAYQARRACRALARLGFAEHEIGLWTEDGEPRGAGYRATARGALYHHATQAGAE